jgi:ATP-binding cassette subfamily B (MDR/TAP) protein 1
LNLTIPYGKKIGFVGVSGCGKSTILSFLLRFYIPQSGEILLNNINIKDYDIHYLRSQFGVVGQEPVVFDTSFKENITYNMKDVSEKDIINVAKKANALSFIVDPLRMKAPLQEQY